MCWGNVESDSKKGWGKRKGDICVDMMEQERKSLGKWDKVDEMIKRDEDMGSEHNRFFENKGKNVKRDG